MRTLRPSLVETVILMLLAGPGGVAAADVEAPVSDGPHQFSGTCTFAGESGAETYGEGDGRWWRHGYPIRQSCEMDDARLSGTLLKLWNHESIGGPIYSGDGEVIAGTVQLINDYGSWVGTMRGHVAYEESGRHHYWQFELTGTGPYEGYSALAYAEGPGGGGQKKVEGFVFPGALPEYPAQPEIIVDPVEVVVAGMDVAAGAIVWPELRWVSAADVGPDFYTIPEELMRRRAAVDIPVGTPITPDLLEPAE